MGYRSGFLMVLAVATVLVFSFRSLSREKTRLLQEFADTVLINILINACDACREGGTIRIAAAPTTGGPVRWEIRDDGEGIPEQHLLAVFDPFFTTKKRGEGTGLGLPVAASIVRNHGGEIALASTPGKGTTVTIHWPAAAEVDHAQG